MTPQLPAHGLTLAGKAAKTHKNPKELHEC